MQGKKQQLIFGLIGLGCGIVLSGVLNLLLLLNSAEYKNGIALNTSQIKQSIIEDVLNEQSVTTSAGMQGVNHAESTEVIELESEVSQSETDEVMITVKIPSKMTASQTCNILQAAGVITDAKDFRNYLIEKQMTTKLNEGTFVLSKNMAYNELLDKLMID